MKESPNFIKLHSLFLPIIILQAESARDRAPDLICEKLNSTVTNLQVIILYYAISILTLIF